MTIDKNDTSEKKIGAVGWMIVGLVALILLRGFVLRSLWNWFAVPAFNARPLGFALTIGLSVLWGTLTLRVSPKDDRSPGHLFSIGFFTLLAAWAIGAAAHWGMG